MTNIPSTGNANEETAVCVTECNRNGLSATRSSYPHNADVQLIDGGPSGTPELLDGIEGPPFAGAPAGFLFFGSLAVNSKMLSRANHGAEDANMPATIIAHPPTAITMLRRVILIPDTSRLTVLLQNTIYHPATEATRANPMPFHCPNSRSPVIIQHLDIIVKSLNCVDEIAPFRPVPADQLFRKRSKSSSKGTRE